MKNIKSIFDFNGGRKLRNIEKMNLKNDGSRSIYESIQIPEVLEALKDWINNNGSNCVLIGGLALSFYVRPRTTMDVDVLFLTSSDIPDTVNKFKRHRKGAFQHNKTHVEVEVISPETINTDISLVEAVFETSILEKGIRIASPAGIVALKLGRFSRQDQADIEALKEYTTIDLTPFKLQKELLDRFDSII